MKTISAKLFFFLGASVLLLACNKDEGPTPAPSPMPEPLTHPVAQVLESNYWQEKICFTYIKTGIAETTIEVSDRDYSLDYYYDGGTFYVRRLQTFSVEPDTRKLRVYHEGTYIGSHYYRNRYMIEYPDQTHVRVRALDEFEAYVGAAFNVDLEVVSCTDNEIVFDGPIKPYIWQEWTLDKVGKDRGIMYLGIRVYWTRIENGSEIYEPSNPLD